MTNIGTLFAFGMVCIAVLVLRYTNPTAPRPFRVPAAPVVCVVGVLGCLLLMFSLPAHNWYRLIVWMLLGLAIYFTYGYWNSHLRRGAVMTPEQRDYREPPPYCYWRLGLPSVPGAHATGLAVVRSRSRSAPPTPRRG
jgi:amino acid transporter